MVCLTFVRCLSLFFSPKKISSLKRCCSADPGAKVQAVKRPLSASHRYPALSRPPLSRIIRRLWWRIIVLFVYNTCFNGTYDLCSEGLVLVKAPSEVKEVISQQHSISRTAKGLMKRVDGTDEAGFFIVFNYDAYILMVRHGTEKGAKAGTMVNTTAEIACS